MQAKAATLGYQDSPNTEPNPYKKGEPKRKRKSKDIPVKEQLKLLEQYHTRKKTSIEIDLDRFKEVLVNNIKNNAYKLNRHKRWVKALCEEIGDSTTKEFEELNASIKKELKELNASIKKEFKELKASINKVHEDGKSNSEVLLTASKYIVTHHKALREVDRIIKKDRLQVSCIATKFRNDMSKLQTDMAKLQTDMAIVLEQNSKLQTRLETLEAKLQST
jgi:hypothetical protein